MSQPDPWTIEWLSPFCTHQYEPVYLANTCFGGMLDLSGVTMDLWSSEICAVPESSDDNAPFLHPVTALRTQVFFRNTYWSGRGFWIGATGLHCADGRYLSDPAMPHLPQVYQCRQSLNLRSGIASTSGTLYPGSQAGLEAGLAAERSIPFTSQVAFLKDEPVAGFLIEADAEILFVPETILEDRFRLDVSGKGIARWGGGLKCDLILRQSLRRVHAQGNSIEYEIEPSGGDAYRVRVSASGATIFTLNERPALLGHGRMFVRVEILPGESPLPPLQPLDTAEFFGEQERRWQNFWKASRVTLPDSESLWQQRYHASLFQVAQSVGRGPTHPGGLSKPMLPHWIGCFHDTDTYFCRPLLESGHGDMAARHLAFRHRTLDAARKLAAGKGQPGALYPWQAGPDGRGQTGEVPMNAAVIACEAWHQYLHTGEKSAHDQSREILSATLENLAATILAPGSPIRLRDEPVHTFSETLAMHDPAEARIALRAVASAYLDATAEEKNAPLRDLAGEILSDLPLIQSPDGGYAVSAEDEPEYLRTQSVTLGSFPLHHLDDPQAVAAAFENELARVVFLFAWLPHQSSIVASQLRRSEGPGGALGLLRQADAFYKPWHAFDEWENRRTARASCFVTAAGGFCTALHHMLIAETAPGTWSLFPGVPDAWGDLSFQNLTTRAGWRVSAIRRDGQTVEVSAEPTHEQAAREFLLVIPKPAGTLAISARVKPESGDGSTLLRFRKA